MAWLQLIFAGFLETYWSYHLKLSEGLTRLGSSILTIIGMIASFYFLSRALRTLPLSIGYAVWTGIGAIGATVVGWLLLKEPFSGAKLFCVLLIAAGIVGLHLTAD